jgi:hypothetical protein
MVGKNLQLSPNKIILCAALLFVSTIPLFAKDADEKDSPRPQADASVSLPTGNPSELIGLNLAKVLTLFGPPDEVFSHRGETAEDDDVVFYYKTKSFYLFWFENRVWVVRFDNRYKDAFFNIRIGMKKEDAVKLLAFPSKEIEGSTIFFLSDEGFPLRLRLYIENNFVCDAYLYRGDY